MRRFVLAWKKFGLEQTLGAKLVAAQTVVSVL